MRMPERFKQTEAKYGAQQTATKSDWLRAIAFGDSSTVVALAID
jgi:hypothetical protein